jgi:hypothetical protein
MLNLSDTRTEKLKTWVPPTLTCIHHGSSSRGGLTSGVTEGSHVVGGTFHTPVTGGGPTNSSNMAIDPGTAAASS